MGKNNIICSDYSTLVKVNEVLDKISKYGIDSMTRHEKEFLDAYSTGDECDMVDKMCVLEGDTFYEDSNFKFELGETKIIEDEIHYIGTLYVPDINFNNGITIEGNLKGEIISFSNGTYSIEFEKNVVDIKGKKKLYDVYDFCSGMEYELDNFIDYIIQELR